MGDEHFHIRDEQGTERIRPADYQALGALMILARDDKMAVPNFAIRSCRDDTCCLTPAPDAASVG